MPPKRRRTSEGVPSTRQRGTTSGPQPHDKLWFDDGSIVLATDVHLYRVHKGMLAKYSKVLSDIFEIPTGGAKAERWEDIPMVRMVGDKDDEVSVLLKSLYDRNFRDTLKGFKMPELSSLLSISTKYDFDDIRADVMQHLISIFPNKFKKLGASKMLWKPMYASQLFDLLVVAHRCEAHLILPILYYLCAIFPIDTIIEEIHILPKECTKRVLRGRDWLCALSQEIIKRSLQASKIGGKQSPICRSSYCLEKFREQLEKKYPVTHRQGFIFIFDVPDHGILEGLNIEQSGICSGCASSYINRLTDHKLFAWDKLPVVFLGKKWEELGRK
ncbi:hypothetical protein SCHPADRAFT_881953 [Schizopora paradoxa]|uniref:BTB domain-containing protein n=1 Tax=Schizopora paradoxa TaxID=27342 RepID=A0A0H2R5T9_9AGAM|nr:hypothetical protein SCHPADRAFT_881953 [Schizopora paradoxa]